MKRFLILFCNIIFATNLFANIGPQGFGQFRQDVFVETGCYLGNGIQLALDAGFKQIHSLEADINYYNSTKYRFRNNSQVTIFYGDSSVDLWDVIKDIDQPITFWLDAHIYPPRSDGGKNCPLIEELEQIKKHPIKTHIILIDDMHCCNTESFDFLGREDFIKKLLEINPDYHIFYVDGGDAGEYKNNVMVAYP